MRDGVRGAPDERLALARGLLDGAPATAVLPVAAPLAGLLPAGGLRRGSTVALPERVGATSLLFALLAAASAEGAWTGVVGRPELGLVAAAEAGLALQRFALVPEPGADLLAVVVALLDGMDVVVVSAPGNRVRAGDRQRLAARARQRGAVLLALGAWPGADIELRCGRGEWAGPGAGAGRLRFRTVDVHRRGRGGAARGGEIRVQLPGPLGRIEPAASDEHRQAAMLPAVEAS